MTASEVPTIAIYNDKSSGETDATIEGMMPALQTQVDRDFGPVWHERALLEFIPSTAQADPNAWTIAILASSDVAGALGYHDLTPGGQPLGKVFAATDRQFNALLSVTISHELLEMLGDPWINLSAQSPVDNNFYAWETCDAVEDDSLAYDIDGVKCSNFCYPSWWGNGEAPFDYGKVCPQALTLAAGGYISIFIPGQGWTQAQAQLEQGLDSAKVAHSVPRVGSRRERRMRGRNKWLKSTADGFSK